MAVLDPTAPPDLEHLTASEVLAFAVERFDRELVVACSFQKEESVLLDLLAPIAPDVRVFTIDTGVLFEETLATWRVFEERWGIRFEVSEALPPGGEPWTAERCCGERKVAALDRALQGAEAWVTGIRREQAPTRAAARKIEWDGARGLWKLNPLADWTERDLWSHIAEHDVPYNPLHDRGYDSIGCAPCTAPGQGREGRWAGQDKTECGLHVVPAGGEA